jgi:hypothetical protein
MGTIMINHRCLRSYSLATGLLAVLLVPRSAAATFTAAPYLPLQSGNSWTYLVDQSFTVTTTVLPGTTTINGVAAKAVQSTGGFTEYYTNDSNGIRLHRQFEPDVFIDGVGTVDLTVTFNPPIRIANAVTDIGQIVNTSGSAQTNPDLEALRTVPASRCKLLMM